MRSAGRERRGWVAAAAVGGMLVLAGCGSSGRSAGEAPVPTVPTTTSPATALPGPTTTTGTIPLDQDPPVIDLAYVQRVLDQISHLDGEASRILYREKRMTAEVEEIVGAAYFSSSLEDNRRALETDLGIGLRTWRDPPADPIMRALKVVSSHPGCIALRADSDLRPRYENYTDIQRNIGVILQRNVQPTPAERRINPSLWLETVSSTTIVESDLLRACQ